MTEVARMESKFLELQGLVVKIASDNDRWLGNHEKAHPSWKEFMSITLTLMLIVVSALIALDLRATNRLTDAIQAAAEQNEKLYKELSALRFQVQEDKKLDDGRHATVWARLPPERRR